MNKRNKPENIKIIQILSHTEGSQGGGYVSHADLIGLGSDGIIYTYRKSDRDWIIYEDWRVTN